MTYDQIAAKQRYAEMLQNAGRWLINNRPLLKLTQYTLVRAYYQAFEELYEKEDPDKDFCGFLSEIEDAIDLLGTTIGGLSSQDFWPETDPIIPEPVSPQQEQPTEQP